MTIAAAALVTLPVLALLRIAASPDAVGIWPHLAANVVAPALWNTALLLAGVAVFAGSIGVAAAWMVTQYEFPGRRAFEWLLVLPLALPTYITAYIYVEVLGFQGALQQGLRALTGYRSLRDYWFPDPRSLPGAIFVMGIVLFPYVYLSVRALFALQGAVILEAARALGAGRKALFWRIALPMARPALAGGITLVLLEVLNDVGASEYLGIRTLTISVYTTWLNRGSLAGAAQIACVMLLVVVALMVAEARSRGDRRFALSARRPRPAPRRPISGRRSASAILVCALPVLFGAVVPIGFLIREIQLRALLWQADAALLGQIANTLLLSAAASAVVVGLGLAIAGALRTGREPWLPTLTRIAGLGYALPGTVLALGLLTPIAALDNGISSAMQSLFGINPGLVMIGSGAALAVAYVVRFLTIAISGIGGGLTRISPRIDDAARSLGCGIGEMARRIHWPLARPAVAAAALLVFVDCIKELPATLLLRPLNFETLATAVYGQASRGLFEEGALAALLIVLSGLGPAILLSRRIPGGA